jgi:hypothetical protein
VTDGEIGLLVDRAWQVEYGDRWREKKQEYFARKARESQQDRERERRQKEAEFERQAAEFAEGVARDVAEMRATFRDIQATLAENARLREERERRLEDWAIDDAWARLRGGR